jgi:hypothetical protein
MLPAIMQQLVGNPDPAAGWSYRRAFLEAPGWPDPLGLVRSIEQAGALAPLSPSNWLWLLGVGVKPSLLGWLQPGWMGRCGRTPRPLPHELAKWQMYQERIGTPGAACSKRLFDFSLALDCFSHAGLAVGAFTVVRIRPVLVKNSAGRGGNF